MKLVKTLLICFAFAHAARAEISVEQVYWWWDDGLIEYNEATDLLELLEHDDEEGACIYAEALGLERCSLKRGENSARKRVAAKKVPKNWDGSLRYRESRDADDAILLRHLDAKFRYDAFAFRGSFAGEDLAKKSWQIAYRRDGYEAILGELRYTDLQMQFPMEVREGTWIAYRSSVSHFGGALFTDSAVAAMAGLDFAEVSLSAWAFDDARNRAFVFEAAGSNFELGAWYALGMESPLYRAALDYKNRGTMDFDWNMLLYAHSDSALAFPLKLPASVRKSRYHLSQTQKFSFAGHYSVTLVERLQVPLDTGKTVPNVSVAFRKSGGMFRTLVGVACRDAASARGNVQCGRPQLRAEAAFALQRALLYSKFRLQSESAASLKHSPRVALGARYTAKEKTFLRTEFVLPEGGASERNPYKLSEEAGINTANAGISLRFIQKKNPREGFTPERAGLTLQVKF